MSISLLIQGSSVKSGSDVKLKADGDIDLLASKSTFTQDGSSSSSSGGVGVAIAFGKNEVGFGVTANASAARGKADGSDVTYSNTAIQAGNKLTITSGGDTNLRGATAEAQQVTAKVGGNLNIESLQDTSTYIRQAITGNTTLSQGEQVLQSLGLSPEAAALTYGIAGVAPVVIERSLANSAVRTFTAADRERVAAQLNNFYRDGASPEIIQQTFNQAAVSSTHNAASSEVVLGKYIAGSADSYEAVAQTRGATYFSMSDWAGVSHELGSKRMWDINKAFLDQQMEAGKKFVFTSDPANFIKDSYGEREFKYLTNKGYILIPDQGGIYRAIKK